MQHISLTDDQGQPLGIQLFRKNRNVVIFGLNIPTLRRGASWADHLLFRAAKAELNGRSHMLVGLRSMTTRNAIRLGFAYLQLLRGGPTYFTETSYGRFGRLIDTADYECPHVGLRPEGRREAE